ncbi:MAG: hypothetical protein U0Q16_04635 [Bryobacteraceae bacterium]
MKSNLPQYRFRLTALLLASACASQAVEVFKEDFEFRSDYGYVSPGATALYPEGKYTVDKNPRNNHPLFASFGDHGTGVGKMLIVNGVANSVVWQRKVSGFNPGQQYVIRLYAASVYPDNPASLQFTVNNTAVGSVLSLPPATGAWRLLTVLVPASTSVQTIKVIDTNGSAGGNDFAIDDFEVVEVGTQRRLLLEDFEAVTQYRYVAPAPSALWDEGTATVDNNPSYDHPYFTYFADHTGSNGNMLIVNGVADLGVWGRIVPNLVAGTTYTVSFYARSAYAYNPARLAVKVNGVTSGQLVLPTGLADGSWVQILAPFTATQAQQQIDIVDTVTGAGGNDFVIDDFTVTTGSPDTTPPQITGLGVAAENSTTALVRWSTNEYATTFVDYGVGALCTGGVPYVDPSFVLNPHQAEIPNLIPNTTYCFTAKSVDQSGNPQSQTVTFTTPPNLAGACDITVYAKKGTARLDGARVSGYVIAYGVAGPWQHYEASVTGELWFIDPSGAKTSVDTFSAPFAPFQDPAGATGTPGTDGYQPPLNSPGKSFPVSLEPRGSGFYYVAGSAVYRPKVNSPCFGLPALTVREAESPPRQILRPDAPFYKPGQPTRLTWLGGNGTRTNGQYSERTTLVAGKPNDPDHDYTFVYSNWLYEQSQPGYITQECATTSGAGLCREAFFRALNADRACHATTIKAYNVLLANPAGVAEGFKSYPLDIEIRRPYITRELPEPGTFPFNDPPDPPDGYKSKFQFNVDDQCGDRMFKYRIWSTPSVASRFPSDTNWDVANQTYYPDPEDYVSAEIKAGPTECKDSAFNVVTCVPTPEFHDPIQQNSPLVVQGSEVWVIGSDSISNLLNPTGLSVRYNDFFMYRDHAAIGGAVTPYPSN